LWPRKLPPTFAVDKKSWSVTFYLANPAHRSLASRET
jgi:hypothetical protein